MIKKLLRSVRAYKTASLLTPIFVTFEVIMEVLIPFFMSRIIDMGLEQNNLSYTVRLGVILIIAASPRCASVHFPENMQRKLRQDLPRISVTTCSIMFRIFHSPTLISSPLPAWLHD